MESGEGAEGEEEGEEEEMAKLGIDLKGASSYELHLSITYMRVSMWMRVFHSSKHISGLSSVTSLFLVGFFFFFFEFCSFNSLDVPLSQQA